MALNYDLILWDLDGTLTNFKDAERNAIRALFSRFGYGPYDDAMIARFSEINEKKWRLIETGLYDKQELLHERFREFFEGEGLPTDRVVEFNADYQSELGETTVYNDDSFNLLSGLKGKIPQYIVTNGTKKAQTKKVANSGFDRICDGVFISEDTGFDKPSDGYFRYVLEHVPECLRKRVLIVGDSLTSDMRGGIRQGFTCVWYNPHGAEAPDDMALDYVIRDLREVRQILGSE